jgi:hypothetical protein
MGRFHRRHLRDEKTSGERAATHCGFRSTRGLLSEPRRAALMPRVISALRAPEILGRARPRTRLYAACPAGWARGAIAASVLVARGSKARSDIRGWATRAPFRLGASRRCTMARAIRIMRADCCIVKLHVRHRTAEREAGKRERDGSAETSTRILREGAHARVTSRARGDAERAPQHSRDPRTGYSSYGYSILASPSRKTVSPNPEPKVSIPLRIACAQLANAVRAAICEDDGRDRSDSKFPW